MTLFQLARRCLCAFFLHGLMALYANDAESVIIVVNDNDADSLMIGEYYAEKRGIPQENIIELDAPLSETISLSDYVETIHNPLINKLIEGGWVEGVKAGSLDHYGREKLAVAIHNIRFLVTVRGIPLRIDNAPGMIESDTQNLPKQFQVNRASVDSELALLPGPPNLSMTGLVPNPYFERDSVSDGDANRVIKVSRLDGPKREDIIRLIDRTLEAESIGLMGRAYIDSGGPHKMGDQWIVAAGELAQEAYFDTDFEASKRAMGFSDRLDAPAIYMGWYKPNAYGPWLREKWPVPPGAIGFHLHSYSATTVRSEKNRWLGPLVAQGYCATFGNVFEPYLQFTHRPHVFLKHLLEGGNFGDAVTKANRALSWQSVAIGDPLYRPFKVSLDDQIASKPEGPFAAYVALRALNRAAANQGRDELVSMAKNAFLRMPSLNLALRLAEIHDSRGEQREVKEALKFIRFLNSFSIDEMVVASKIADLLNLHGNSEMSLSIYEKMLSRNDLPKALRIKLLEGGQKSAALAGDATLSSRWSFEALNLKTPSKKKK